MFSGGDDVLPLLRVIDGESFPVRDFVAFRLEVSNVEQEAGIFAGNLPQRVIRVVVSLCRRKRKQRPHVIVPAVLESPEPSGRNLHQAFYVIVDGETCCFRVLPELAAIGGAVSLTSAEDSCPHAALHHNNT